MFLGYYADEQMAKLRQEELTREIEHDYLVAQAKQGQRSFRLFRRNRTEEKLQLAKPENRQHQTLK